MKYLNQFYRYIKRISDEKYTKEEIRILIPAGAVTMLIGAGIDSGLVVCLGVIVLISGLAGSLEHSDDR